MGLRFAPFHTRKRTRGSCAQGCRRSRALPTHHKTSAPPGAFAHAKTPRSYWKFSLSKHRPAASQTLFQSSLCEPPKSGNVQPHQNEMGRGTASGATYFSKRSPAGTDTPHITVLPTETFPQPRSTGRVRHPRGAWGTAELTPGPPRGSRVAEHPAWVPRAGGRPRASAAGGRPTGRRQGRGRTAARYLGCRCCGSAAGKPQPPPLPLLLLSAVATWARETPVLVPVPPSWMPPLFRCLPVPLRQRPPLLQPRRRPASGAGKLFLADEEPGMLPASCLPPVPVPCLMVRGAAACRAAAAPGAAGPTRAGARGSAGTGRPPGARAAAGGCGGQGPGGLLAGAPAGALSWTRGLERQGRSGGCGADSSPRSWSPAGEAGASSPPALHRRPPPPPLACPRCRATAPRPQLAALRGRAPRPAPMGAAAASAAEDLLSRLPPPLVAFSGRERGDLGGG